MPKREIARLMSGFKQFKEKFYLSEDPDFAKLRDGWQGPKSLIIACSDSRVDPAILASAGPGDLFVVRNIAALVPPYEEGGGYHGVSSAIEFAVLNLQVEHVIIMGHRQCGGIRALVYPQPNPGAGFLQRWVQMASSAKDRALKAVGEKDPNALLRCCEMESIRTSLQNLRTFPFVTDAVKTRGMALHGIYFDIERGELLDLNEASGEFSPLRI